MEILIGFFIFCLVLFIYLHVQFHLKTSNDLEMYEIDIEKDIDASFADLMKKLDQ